MSRPPIAVTMGDPAGIGPEIVLKALLRSDVRRLCRPVVYGDAAWLAGHFKFLPRSAARRAVVAVVDSAASGVAAPVHVVPVVDFANVPTSLRLGRVAKAAGAAAGDYLAAAVRAALSGEVSAVVTAPIHKVAFGLGRWGKRFVGHTETLAGLTGARAARLMLVNGAVRAVHVTSHIPLSDVPRAVTRARVLETIRTAHEGLRAMGVARPRVAVCGLNPHAGDGGLLGTEEARVIAPAVRAARRGGINAIGPLSPDIVWPEMKAGRYDVGVAMYHEQGQIPIKLLGLDTAVNVTLGLPIVRTSPAHGTAFDIAGRGRASEESLVSAIRLAAKMAVRP